MVYIDPLEADGLDNDGDGEIDEAGGEGSIVPNNRHRFSGRTRRRSSLPSITATRCCASTPATASRSTIASIRTIASAPQQQLVETAYATYDSLENDSGNQSDPRGANGEPGGARQYTSATAQATIQIIPVEVQPKTILRLSNTPSICACDAAAGVDRRGSRIRAAHADPGGTTSQFPSSRQTACQGMSCADAPVVDLDAPPYDAAGFVPGGVFHTDLQR